MVSRLWTALLWMLLLKCTQPWSLPPLGTLARPEMPEVVHVLGVSGAGGVSEVPQRAPVVTQPLTDLPVPGVDVLRVRRGVPVVDDDPGDVRERLVQRAGLGRVNQVRRGLDDSVGEFVANDVQVAGQADQPAARA